MAKKKDGAEAVPAADAKAAGGFTQKEKEAMAMLAMAVGFEDWGIRYVELPYGSFRTERISPAGKKTGSGYGIPEGSPSSPDGPRRPHSPRSILGDAAPTAVKEADEVYGAEGWTELKARLDEKLQKNAGEWSTHKEPPWAYDGVCSSLEVLLWENWKIRRDFAELYLKNGDFLRRKADVPMQTPKDALRAISTEEAALKAAQADGRVLEFINPALRTPKVCAAAVNSCAEAAAFVPPRLHDAVEQIFASQAASNPGSIRFLPEEFRTPAVCAQAVLAGGTAVIEHVPAGGQAAAKMIAKMMDDPFKRTPGNYSESFLARELRENLGYAAKKSPQWREELQKCAAHVLTWRAERFSAIPAELQNDALRLAACRQDGQALEYMPNAFKTAEICLAAVKQKAWALRHVPEELKTEEICLEAVRSCPASLELTPESFQTEERCIDCIKRLADADLKDRFALAIVAPSRRTPEVCLAAIERESASWRAVPPEAAADERLWAGAVSRLGLALDCVPKPMATESVCLAAIAKNPAELKAVPEGTLTERECLAAAEQDGMLLRFVPERLRTPEVCLAAARQNSLAMAWVPEALDTESFRRLAALASPAAAACAAFASHAEECGLQSGRLEIKRLGGGRTGVRVSASDPGKAGGECFVQAVYCPGHGQAEAAPSLCLQLFAGKLEGTSGKPADSMPEDMKALCAKCIRRAADAMAKAAEACAAEAARAASDADAASGPQA